jgi:hypothetical protein
MEKKQPKESSPLHKRSKKPTDKLVERQNEIRSQLADLRERNPRYPFLDVGADGSSREMPPEYREMQKLEHENCEIAKKLNPDFREPDECWNTLLNAISEERQRRVTGDQLAANRSRTEPSRPQNSDKTAQTVETTIRVEQKEPTGWHEVEITFLSVHRVTILSNDKNPKTYNYGELGFQDRRSGKGEEPRPNRAWVMLCEMAKHGGTLPRPSPGKERTMVQKRIEEIRERLRGHFGIEGDPIPFNRNVYQTSFKINCGPSFNT